MSTRWDQDFYVVGPKVALSVSTTENRESVSVIQLGGLKMKKVLPWEGTKVL